MTKGEGLVGLLYALKDLVNTFAIMFITGIAVIAFFWMIVKFIGAKYGMFGGSGGILGNGKKIDSKMIMWALILLFVIFGIYSLIGLTAAIFGVNSSPSGGLLVQ